MGNESQSNRLVQRLFHAFRIHGLRNNWQGSPERSHQPESEPYRPYVQHAEPAPGKRRAGNGIFSRCLGNEHHANSRTQEKQAGSPKEKTQVGKRRERMTSTQNADIAGGQPLSALAY